MFVVVLTLLILAGTGAAVSLSNSGGDFPNPKKFDSRTTYTLNPGYGKDIISNINSKEEMDMSYYGKIRK